MPLPSPLSFRAVAVAAALAGLPPAIRADSAAPVSPHTVREAVAEMTSAVTRFRASLDDAQKAKSQFPFDDAERENWHFIPKARKGLPLGDLRPEQTALAFGLLSSALSSEGMQKVTGIISLEQVLHQLENNSPTRNPAGYYLSFFGQPEGKRPWGWRFEGHHLAFNVTVDPAGTATMTPTFFGANPGEVREGPRAGLRILRDEEDIARDLVRGLTPEQRTKAVLQADVPADIITGAQRRVSPLEPVGIPSSELTEAQRTELWKLVGEYVNRFRPDLTGDLQARIRSGDPAVLTFAWAGGTEPGQGHYYRIQNREFLFEYDNTQNGAKHPHTAWRDFANDFGADLLRRHYDEAHAPGAPPVPAPAR